MRLRAGIVLMVAVALWWCACSGQLGGGAGFGADGLRAEMAVDLGAYESGIRPDRGRPTDGLGPLADGPTAGSDLPPLQPCGGGCRLPPGPSCVDEKTLRNYAPTGTCLDGECRYTPTDSACPGSCRDGYCLRATKTLYVDANAAAGGDGSLAAPLRSIGAAVTKSSGLTAIFVAGGSYGEQLKIEGKELELLGGYAPGFASRDPSVHTTTIDSPAGPSVLLSGAGQTVIAGFAITGAGRGIDCSGGAPVLSGNRIYGNRIGDLEALGGGIWAYDGCNMKVFDNVIENNAAGRGGGIATIRNSIEIRRNVIRNNTGLADHGGATYLLGTVEMHHNLVAGNATGRTGDSGWGGGIALITTDGKGNFSFNTVVGNYARTSGSGVFIDDGATSYHRNELYVDNECPQYGDGAAVSVDGGNGPFSNATFVNVTMVHNCSSGRGRLIHVEESHVVVSNSVMAGPSSQLDDSFSVDKGGSLRISYSNAPHVFAGAGNISADPQFAVGSGSEPVAYRLKSTAGRWDGKAWVVDAVHSPSIDAADPSSSYAEEPAPNGGRANMGAFGGTEYASKSR